MVRNHLSVKRNVGSGTKAPLCVRAKKERGQVTYPTFGVLGLTHTQGDKLCPRMT